MVFKDYTKNFIWQAKKFRDEFIYNIFPKLHPEYLQDEIDSLFRFAVIDSLELHLEIVREVKFFPENGDSETDKKILDYIRIQYGENFNKSFFYNRASRILQWKHDALRGTIECLLFD